MNSSAALSELPHLILQMVCWVAEEQQLMANPKKPAQGTIIEAFLDKQKGSVATLLVQVRDPRGLQ